MGGPFHFSPSLPHFLFCSHLLSLLASFEDMGPGRGVGFHSWVRHSAFLASRPALPRGLLANGRIASSSLNA
jgi:hypothetical protein